MYKAHLHNKKHLNLPDVVSCDGETPRVGHLMDFPLGKSTARFRVKAVIHRQTYHKDFGSRKMTTLVHAEFETYFSDPDSYSPGHA